MNRFLAKILAAAGVAAFAAASFVSAQVTYPGGAYSQNFNTLPAPRITR